MRKRQQFKVDTHSLSSPYEPMFDKHLEYYFASRNHRRILIKAKLINRKNEVIDHSLQKLLQHGTMPLINSFRLRKTIYKGGKGSITKQDFDAYIKNKQNLLQLDHTVQNQSEGGDRKRRRKSLKKKEKSDILG